MLTEITQIVKHYGLLLGLLIIALPVYAGPPVVGHISFAKGNNVAQLSGSAPRTLDKNTEIFQGDTIKTIESGFVIIEFTDGAKVTVRPNSDFSIDHYDDQSAKKTAQLVLNKGEINTSTGEIAKENPENFQITTPTGTVRPESKKAEFSVDICEKNCDKNQEAAVAAATATGNQQVVKLEQNLVARVVEIKGEVSAVNRANKDAKERALALGTPVYNADSIHSKKDSWALLVFPDGEKVTLQPDSEMDIKQYNYQVNGKKDQVLLRLAMGGLRALSGNIGKNDHDAFSLETPVATIGIRGTETFTVITKAPSSSSLVDINHRTLQGVSVARYTDADGKSSEAVVPAGSTLQMTGTPAPTGPAPAGGAAPTAVIAKPPVVKPTPPDAVQPKGPSLIPDPAATKALFVVTAAPVVTVVKMISGDGKVVSKNGQNATVINPGDTGTIKPNSDLTVYSSTAGNNKDPANNTNSTPPADPNKPADNTKPNATPLPSAVNIQPPTAVSNTPNSESQTSNRTIIENVKQKVTPASPS
ncbi:MAG: FecR domain-containing protein [Methylobacter sp.]|nr:FecR domain-containing protein [Methylobacter sp.]